LGARRLPRGSSGSPYSSGRRLALAACPFSLSVAAVRLRRQTLGSGERTLQRRRRQERRRVGDARTHRGDERQADAPRPADRRR
jgi:hypothetical protein